MFIEPWVIIIVVLCACATYAWKLYLDWRDLGIVIEEVKEGVDTTEGEQHGETEKKIGFTP